jgi:hypothetical protein
MDSFKYKPAHTSKEAEEFKELKHTLNSRGFLLNEETKRWNYLFNKLAARVIPALNEIGELGRLEISN